MGATMKVGLFGGSFDPIHRGHIDPVLAASRELGLDWVYYLPTAQPPHKPARRFAPAWARFAMVELALLEHPQLLVSTHELTQGRPAYTVDTLEYFRDHFADEHQLEDLDTDTDTEVDLHLLIGADSYNELDQWVRWRAILELARIVVLVRPGDEEVPEHLPEALREPKAGRVVRVENPPLDISSTRIREALARGETPPPEVLPAPVLDYCRKYRLYEHESS
jgi:nicotinate-nucleotide adenylyltransferase